MHVYRRKVGEGLRELTDFVLTPTADPHPLFLSSSLPLFLSLPFSNFFWGLTLKIRLDFGILVENVRKNPGRRRRMCRRCVQVRRSACAPVARPGWDRPAGDVNLMALFGAFAGHYLQQWMNPWRLVLVAAGRVRGTERGVTKRRPHGAGRVGNVPVIGWQL